MKKLALKHQIFFAVGGAGENITFQAVSSWLFFFWAGQGEANKALIPAALLGLLLGVGRILDLNKSTRQKHINLRHAITATFKNSQFLIFSASLILFSMGLNLLNALLPFYVKIILGLSQGTVGLFSALVLISMLIALPIQTKMSNILGKNKVYAISMLLLGITFPMLAFVGIIPTTNPFAQLMSLTILIGLYLSGQFIFPNAILADVIDYDAAKTKLRREAIYYGCQNTLQKLSFAVSSIVFGTTLSIFGATTDNPLGILLIGPIAGIATLLGFFIFVRWYKLPEHIKADVEHKSH